MRVNILLLDEPSAFYSRSIKKKQELTLAKHLDLLVNVRLQSYLTNETEGQTIVVVSHDRKFLDAVTEERIVLEIRN